ncbi:hypothetical protein MNBD_ACTINO02-1045, partial [hydrothermal vent metagenome]
MGGDNLGEARNNGALLGRAEMAREVLLYFGEVERCGFSKRLESRSGDDGVRCATILAVWNSANQALSFEFVHESTHASPRQHYTFAQLLHAESARNSVQLQQHVVPGERNRSRRPQVGFVGRHFGLTKVRGRFTGVSGEVVIKDNIGDSTVTVDIDVSSVSSGDQTRDDHLRSEDLFDVTKHPSATFVSTELSTDGAT